MDEKRSGGDRRGSDRRKLAGPSGNRRTGSERRQSERRKGDRRQINIEVAEDRRMGKDRRKKSDRRVADDRRVEERRSNKERRSLEDRREKKTSSEEDDESGLRYEDMVVGRNPVLELLKTDRDINKLYVESGEKHGSIREIIAKAKEQKVVIVEKDRAELNMMAGGNQGVIAVVPPFNYVEVEDILEYAKSKNEDPFIIILDGVEDPHNLGAIIRTAETSGAHGVIIPKRRAANVNSTVVKTSAGATSYMRVARVNNITETIKKLKENGIWVVATDGEAKTLYFDQDLKGPIGIIIGNEGNGISKLIKENSDIFVKIPMSGNITSLNASVSAGIIMYEVVRQRGENI